VRGYPQVPRTLHGEGARSLLAKYFVFFLLLSGKVVDKSLRVGESMIRV